MFMRRAQTAVAVLLQSHPNGRKGRRGVVGSPHYELPRKESRRLKVRPCEMKRRSEQVAGIADVDGVDLRNRPKDKENARVVLVLHARPRSAHT